MRLKAHEIDAIKAAAADAFGGDAVVRLFGSRVHDHLRGGDIDLLIEATVNDEWRATDIFRERLFARIDRQKVDVLVARPAAERSPIEAIAYRDGMIL